METKPRKNKFFQEHRYWVWLMLALVFFFGLVGRFYDFDDPPLDFHPTRQLHSMLIARGMYYEGLEDAPPEQRELAVHQWKSEGQIEPPIMERLSAWGYRLFGTDDLRIPRFLSIFFWTIGGIGLFCLMRELVGEKGAVLGLAYYMVLPFPLYASRSFQPESLMTAAIIISWWTIVRWAKNKNWLNAVIAGITAGLAIYVKSPTVFFVAPALIAIVVTDQKLIKTLTNRQVLLIAGLTVLPALIYHIDGMYISGFLQNQTSFRVFPDLLKDPFHYLQWKDVINSTLGIEFFLFSIAGALVIKNKPYRVMVLSIFVGYFLYGMVFSYHIVTHNYYQIPLTPVIGIGLAACAAVLIEKLPGKKTFGLAVLTGLTFFWMAFNFWDARMSLKHARYHDQPGFYAVLGEKLRDYSVISITPDYGYRLAYWGWKPTQNWMSMGDFVMREMAGMDLDKNALFAEALEGRELFLVTDFAEFDRQADVKEILLENYPIFEEGDGFLIFLLR
ncbi:MAG TPA: glycosyltransferase family 39 protein [Brevefilum fermentans]|nr:glycosyltransferase family 39 protein [Brevefilum fermentans]